MFLDLRFQSYEKSITCPLLDGKPGHRKFILHCCWRHTGLPKTRGYPNHCDTGAHLCIPGRRESLWLAKNTKICLLQATIADHPNYPHPLYQNRGLRLCLDSFFLEWRTQIITWKRKTAAHRWLINIGKNLKQFGAIRKLLSHPKMIKTTKLNERNLSIYTYIALLYSFRDRTW